jgi:hypothetical protein
VLFSLSVVKCLSPWTSLSLSLRLSVTSLYWYVRVCAFFPFFSFPSRIGKRNKRSLLPFFFLRGAFFSFVVLLFAVFVATSSVHHHGERVLFSGALFVGCRRLSFRALEESACHSSGT